MSVVAIIQARMRASRLPGKVLLPLNGVPVISHVCRRVGMVAGVNNIIIATTTEPDDNRIADWTLKNGYSLYRGSMDDVLERYYHAAKSVNASTVIRITSDCPCLDPNLISSMFDIYQQGGTDYLSNALKRTFPHGLDGEIFSFAALENAYQNAVEKPYREHVTPYIYRSGNFRCIDYLNSDYKECDENIRLTLDVVEDYALISAVYNLLGDNFLLSDIINLFSKYPQLRAVNSNVVQKKVYDSISDEIKDAIELLKLRGMDRAMQIVAKSVEK